MTPEQSTLPAGLGNAVTVVQDIGVALLSLGPVPLTVLAGVLIGIFTKMLLNVFGAVRGRDVVIPLIVIVATSVVFWMVQSPSVEGTAPHTMRYPVIRTFIVGAALGFVSIWVHRRFVRDTKLERMLTGAKEDEAAKPTVDVPTDKE